MARRAKQDEMFDQPKIAAIEAWADKFDEKRELVNKITGERDNAELKLMETMHKNIDKLDKQEGKGGEKLHVYKRGDYTVVIKEKESLNVKIKKASKPPGVDEDDSGDGGGDQDEEE